MPSDTHVKPTDRTTDVIGARVIAQTIDIVITFVWLIAGVGGLSALVGPPEGGAAGYVLFSALTLPLYGGLLEAYWNGQTIGKRLTGVRVVDSYGSTPSFGSAALRNIPAVIVFGWLPALVGLAAIATDDRHQRLFDRVAETYVVDTHAPPTDDVQPGMDRRHTPMSVNEPRG
ncbi:RDD family protein [Halobacteriales archaeon QS_4_70_19]|nr:MAG: RDD family protein [Halobacteriales archaeon QS_4_70_19]